MEAALIFVRCADLSRIASGKLSVGANMRAIYLSVAVTLCNVSSNQLAAEEVSIERGLYISIIAAAISAIRKDTVRPKGKSIRPRRSRAPPLVGGDLGGQPMRSI